MTNNSDAIINFFTDEKTLNLLQTLGIMLTMFAAFRAISIAKRIQRRHYREEYYGRHKGHHHRKQKQDNIAEGDTK